MDKSHSSTQSLADRDSTCSMSKKSLKEGSVQMTSLSTLLSFHRYFFLYHDTLVVSKQKGACQYKLKEKLPLDKVWVASSNTADAFLLGWPLTNYLLHFRNREEKEEWYELLSFCIQQNLKPKATNICMDINVRGRKQVIRRRVENGRKSGELVVDTASDLGLPNASYELKIVIGDNAGKSLQGPENVYAVVMAEIERHGIRLSESQRQSLDCCPVASARLVLSSMKSTKHTSAMQIVNSFKKKMLSRTESRGLFGRELDCASPPQTIMTIIDRLRIDGFDAEGIFRKSPKQSTFKELRCELDKGLVPDFSKYSTHVLASMLKEYVRNIPGKLLLNGNYDMWMAEIVDEPDHENKLQSARTLLHLLPSSHQILLANLLKLLYKISQSESSKMTSSALSVCLGPSLLDCPDPIKGGKKIPLLVEFLIDNAVAVLPAVSAENMFAVLDTPELDHNANKMIDVFSDDDSQTTPVIEEIDDDDLSEPPNTPPPEPPVTVIEYSARNGSTDATPNDAPHRDGTSRNDPKLETTVLNSPSISFAALPTRSRSESKPEEPLLFSSDDESDDARSPSRSFSRSSFLSETLKTENLKNVKEEPLSSKLGQGVLWEERREAPRSPCMKRIHFQRTEQQHRINEAKLDFPWKKDGDEIPPRRKQSKEEATQTADHSLLADLSELPSNLPTAVPCSRYPEFKSRATHCETSSQTSPAVPPPHPPVFRSIVDGVRRTDDYQKPTVQVPPFCSEPSSPSLRSLAERLSQLKTAQEKIEESPKPERKISNTIGDPPSLITERFAPYCIEPLKNDAVLRRTMHRSMSTKTDEKREPFTRDNITRTSSVKSRRGGADCVGMDIQEINWSVTHLKTLFQDARAPAINTDYTH